MKDDERQIADKVRGVAGEKRVSQERVAEVIGISRQAVSKRYNARVPFTGAEILRLAREFDVPVTRFFPEDLLSARAAS